MPTTYLADMVAQLRIDLGDPVGTPAWADAALQRAIDRSVSAYSLHHPYQQKATIATVLNDYAISIASLTGRISVDKLEFPVGDKPPTFKPFTLVQETLFMEEYGDAANCYIYWSGIHTLTDASRTFNIKDSNLISLGALAYALEQHADTTLVAKISAALVLSAAALAKVSSKVTLAETDLTSAAGVATDIATQLASAGTQLTAALAALASAISTAGGSIDAAIAAKLTDVATRITAATTSLTAATTATSAATVRIAAAVTDLASGDDYIPTANIGLDPGGKWAVYAGIDIDAANAYNQEAANFLQQAAQNIAEAHAELAHIKALDDKRNAYIAAGAQYIAAADSYTKTAAELNHKRTAYIQSAGIHVDTASAHIMEGRHYQQNAAGYKEEAKLVAAQAKAKMASFEKLLTIGSIQKQLKTTSLILEE
jgi:hypothetical protein